MPERTPDKTATGIVDSYEKGAWLGDPVVLGGLLREFAAKVLGDVIDSDDSAAALDAEARKLARVLLGQSKEYRGPRWFRPGGIDAHVAMQYGVDSDDPEERVAGALVDVAVELVKLQARVGEEKLLREQWQPMADEILDRATREFLGVPPDAPFPDDAGKAGGSGPKNYARR